MKTWITARGWGGFCRAGSRSRHNIGATSSMRSRRSLLVTTFALLLVCVSALPAAAQQGGASQFIRKLGDQAIQVMQQQNLPLDARETQFRAILAEGFDLNFIGQFALGRSWQGATPEQRTTYQ